jgi:hypothetical protein
MGEIMQRHQEMVHVALTIRGEQVRKADNSLQ